MPNHLTATKNLKMPKGAPVQFLKSKSYAIVKQDEHGVCLIDEQGSLCTLLDVLPWRKHFVEKKKLITKNQKL